ncbi:uncharacterized protein L203_105823 [Cryptococcus depauperatus CBS 7841]|uniref:Uncharacterized protein n=1 Tax=Cryptococcus depauperatus CBS 7841 TaxID=1295531 RepID=A0AAJ8M3U9_9TREE
MAWCSRSWTCCSTLNLQRTTYFGFLICKVKTLQLLQGGWYWIEHLEELPVLDLPSTAGALDISWMRILGAPVEVTL